MTRAFQSEEDQAMLEALRNFSRLSQSSRMVVVQSIGGPRRHISDAQACGWALEILEGEPLAALKLAHLKRGLRTFGGESLYKLIMGEDL